MSFLIWLSRFQSTLPYGSDQLKLAVSIRNGNFNPRSLTGATIVIVSQSNKTVIFQSTLPYGSDGQGDRVIILHKYFNPRSLTGATSRVRKSTTNDRYFNPRSLTGATGRMHLRLNLTSNFNPRSLTGATVVLLVSSLTRLKISIHAPLRERHHAVPRLKNLKSNFNPRSLTGATYWTIWNEWFRDEFQSTLPYGSDH